MSGPFVGAERRQFGRRAVNAAATAVLPSGVELACSIMDLSDGGALLQFDSGVAPIENFDLVVDDTCHRLRCEIRHRKGARIGVMFLSLAQGMALNRDLLRPAAEPYYANRFVPEEPPKATTTGYSVRELRRAVMGGPVEPVVLAVVAAPAVAEVSSVQTDAPVELETDKAAA